MRIPKKYGESKVDKCPFCNRQAMTSNPQGIPVCLDHKKEELKDLKCACGDWLDLKKGKYGSFFNCINCGSVSFSKAIEMNQKTFTPKKVVKPKEITVTSDEVDFI